MEGDNKQKKRIQLNRNNQKGKLAEEWVKNTAPLRDRIAKKTSRRSDFELKRVGPSIRDPFTGKAEPDSILAEVKSGKARQSKLQKETKVKKQMALRSATPTTISLAS